MPSRALIVLLLLVAALPARADLDRVGSSLYTVRGAVASATADDGVKAKERAHEEGLRSAVRIALGQLTLARDHGRLADLVAGDPRRFVSEYSVRQESARPRAYRALLDVALDRVAVRGALADAGLRPVEVRAPPILVMPVTVRAGAVDWGADDWRRLWKAVETKEGMLPLAVFNASRQDRSYFDGTDPALGPTVVQLMALRYDAEFAIVAVLEDEAEGVKVTLTGADAVGPIRLVQTFGGLRDVASDPLPDALAAVVAELTERWKAAVLGAPPTPVRFARLGPQDRNGVTVVEAGLVRDSAGRLPDVDAIAALIADLPDVAEVVPTEAGTVRLSLRGGPDASAAALAERGVTLVRSGDKWWLATY